MGIKAWVEEQLHKKGLDVVDHGVTCYWGAGYLEERSSGSWAAGTVMLEQVQILHKSYRLCISTAYDHLYALSKGGSLVDLKVDRDVMKSPGDGKLGMNIWNTQMLCGIEGLTVDGVLSSA